MKIAILGIKTLPAKAGADRVVEKLLENYSSLNEYYIYLIRSDNNRLTCNKNLHYIYIPYFGGKHLKAFSYFLFCTLHFILKGDYDIVHIHNSDFGFFTFLIKMKKRTKIVGTFHGDPYLRTKWSNAAKLYLKLSEIFFIRNSDILTSVSRVKCKEIDINKNKKIVYIPNGIERDPNIVSAPAQLKKIFDLRKNEYFLFACGRLDSTKGLHHLISAYLKGNFRYKLLIIGDFSHDKMYSKKIEDLASRNKNIILNKNLLNKNDLFYVLKNSKLFIFPSEIEAMSMMLLEAISCESNIICSNIEENIEIVGDNYKYLFQNKDDVDLLIKMNDALNDKDLERNMSELKKAIIYKFNWQTIANKYEQIYYSIKN
ncbi:MAG: glycosyltransferase family 4 protein [Ignavibacterium sp.]